MAFTMAYPNFKKGLKMAFGPLGVQSLSLSLKLALMILSGDDQVSQTLEFAYVLNARQLVVEKSGPYCFIGVGLLKNQTPLPIE
jgi:hypothetical protein